MDNRPESEIKTECLEDLFTAMEIVGESNHPNKDRISDSLKTVDNFCERWWEI